MTTCGGSSRRAPRTEGYPVLWNQIWGKELRESIDPTRGADAYAREILDAYEGELLGFSFFQEMSRLLRHDVYARRAFSLLCEVERVTGRLMFDMLARHHIEPTEAKDVTAQGRKLAQLMEPLAWDRLIEEMEARISPAVTRFEKLLLDAPAADFGCIELLVEHEKALQVFVQCKPHRTNDALRPSVRYLRRVRQLNPAAFVER